MSASGVTGTGPGTVGHCTSCGRPAAECAGCARTLDPPHYCGACGTRLAVRVSPGGWVGRCKHHGEVAHS
ncbi:hypothetical protein BH10ACT1_BH10ACT1_43550 [soil metagenome]